MRVLNVNSMPKNNQSFGVLKEAGEHSVAKSIMDVIVFPTETFKETFDPSGEKRAVYDAVAEAQAGNTKINIEPGIAGGRFFERLTGLFFPLPRLGFVLRDTKTQLKIGQVNEITLFRSAASALKKASKMATKLAK